LDEVKKKKSVFVTTLGFIEEFIESIRNRTQDIFKDKFTGCDYLIMDDIDDIRGKIETQNELVYMLNLLLNTGKTVIISGSAHPDSKPGLESRLAARLSWGKVVEIKPHGMSAIKPEY
jgi:chromosomal replication initiator protein